MLLSHSKSLLITFVFIIASSVSAADTNTTPSASSLPLALQQSIPLCAQACTRASLANAFPVACTAQDDIECLCSQYSNTGEALGEVALSCVYSSCASSDVSRGAASAYNACLGQKDAVLPTRTTLTVVATNTVRSTSTLSVNSIATLTTISTSTIRTQARQTQTAFVDSGSIVPPLTSTSAPSPTAVAAAVGRPAKISPAYIAGLSVAAVAAFVIVAGLVALGVCLRRRKKRKYLHNSGEKGTSQQPKWSSTRASRYVSVGSYSESPKIFPRVLSLTPPKGGKHDMLNVNLSNDPSDRLQAARPKQRLGVGTLDLSSNSSLPIDHIELAISAESDGIPAAPGPTLRPFSKPQMVNVRQSRSANPIRRISAMSQDTVFEEDGFLARRRSSILLPTPPVPIAPIRKLQPSREQPRLSTGGSQVKRESELFLSLPAGYERSGSRMINAAEIPPNNSPKYYKDALSTHPEPPAELTPSLSFQSKATSASSRELNNTGDVIDYYFSPYPRPQTRADASHLSHSKATVRKNQVKAKTSWSTLSRTTSLASSNNRNSLWSQTSFETADPNDPTPELEDNSKQLPSDSQPHIRQDPESPISNLRYPKVPRASNQLVPRSPASQQNHQSPHRPPQPARVLPKRQHDLPPLLLETRPRLKSAANEHCRSPPSSRENIVRPLNIRRKGEGGEVRKVLVEGEYSSHEMSNEVLRKPQLDPRSMPKRKDDDWFISIGLGSDMGGARG